MYISRRQKVRTLFSSSIRFYFTRCKNRKFFTTAYISVCFYGKLEFFRDAPKLILTPEACLRGTPTTRLFFVPGDDTFPLPKPTFNPFSKRHFLPEKTKDMPPPRLYIYAENAAFSAYLCNAGHVFSCENRELRNDFPVRKSLEKSLFCSRENASATPSRHDYDVNIL